MLYCHVELILCPKGIFSSQTRNFSSSYRDLLILIIMSGFDSALNMNTLVNSLRVQTKHLRSTATELISFLVKNSKVISSQLDMG